MSWLVPITVALCLLGTMAFVLRARLLGEDGTAFPAAPFAKLALIDLVAAVLAIVALSALVGHLSPPPWMAIGILLLDGYGVLELVRLFRRRTIGGHPRRRVR